MSHLWLSKAYEGEALKKSCVDESCKWFKKGCKNVEDDERSCHQRSHGTDKNIEKAWNMVHPDRH